MLIQLRENFSADVFEELESCFYSELWLNENYVTNWLEVLV